MNSVNISKPESLWSQIRNVINSYEIGEEFTRKEFRKKLNNPKTGSFDLYRHNLTIVGVIDKIGLALYKKNCNIPENLTTTKLNKFVAEKLWWNTKLNWKDWFMELEDRLRTL
jgi:hypothetical protein